MSKTIFQKVKNLFVPFAGATLTTVSIILFICAKWFNMVIINVGAYKYTAEIDLGDRK